jgi:hypothetical protein
MNIHIYCSLFYIFVYRLFIFFHICVRAGWSLIKILWLDLLKSNGVTDGSTSMQPGLIKGINHIARDFIFFLIFIKRLAKNLIEEKKIILLDEKCNSWCK